MNKFWLILGVMLLTFGSLKPANSTIITNGDFSSGLSGWTINNLDHLPLGITSVDIDGPGPLASSDAFFVQTAGGSTSHAVSISQSIALANAGAYTLSADIGASFFPTDRTFNANNRSAGIITVRLDGKIIASHDFKEITANSWEFASLSASFIAASAAILDINFFRPFLQGIDSPVNYLDNVLLLSNNAAVTPVSETSTLLLLATGLAGLAGFSRRKFLK